MKSLKKVVLLLFLSLFTVTKSCTPAVCRRGDPKIRFPFRIQTRQSKSCSYPEIDFDLTCDSTNQTTINLPFSGNFTVQGIDYAEQRLWINDPQNCLARRILSLNLSDSKFTGVYSQTFSFFNCSSDFVQFQPFYPIACLSGDNHTVFATASSRVVNYLSTRCRLVKNVGVPVEWPLYDQVSSSDLSENLLLKWKDPDCRKCEYRGGICDLKTNSSREVMCSRGLHQGIPRSARYALIIGAGIPGILCFLGILCFIFSMIRSCIRRRSGGPVMDYSMAVISQRRTVVGLDGATLDSYPKIVLGESRRLPKPDDNTCSICLSEYKSKETLKSIPQCQHCFHLECIDEWLRLNATCPICRNSPAGESLC